MYTIVASGFGPVWTDPDKARGSHLASPQHFETQTQVNAEPPCSVATVRLWHDGQHLWTLPTANIIVGHGLMHQLVAV